MTLTQFNSKYVYQTDKKKFGYVEAWEIIEPINGKYIGDCESYMLTIKKLGLIPKDTELYYCKINWIGHCVGIYKGTAIDCGTQKFISLDKYTKLYKITNLRKYWKIEIFWKRLTTKIFGFVPFVKG